MLLRPLPRFLTVVSFCALVSAVPVLSAHAELSINPYPLGDQAVENFDVVVPVVSDRVIERPQEKVKAFEEAYVPDVVHRPVAPEPYTEGDQYIKQPEYKSMVRQFHDVKASRPEYLNESVLEEPYVPSFVNNSASQNVQETVVFDDVAPAFVENLSQFQGIQETNGAAESLVVSTNPQRELESEVVWSQAEAFDPVVEAPVFQPQSRPVSEVFVPQSSWHTFSGADLREVLETWSQANNIELIWNLAERYSVRETVVIEDRFENAVAALLGQYEDLYVRPVASLHVSPDGQGKTLVIFSYEGR